MFGAGKVGMSQAGPGGIIMGPGAPTVLVEGMVVSCGGDAVKPHGENMHATPFILPPSASKTVLAMGRGVTVMTRSKANCGHPVMIGAPTVLVGL